MEGSSLKQYDLPGGITVDVVGESFYAAALRGLADDGPRERWACLVPDPDNPYDPNAVRVLIDGIHVGHLDRGTAIAFRPVADRIRELGCEARCVATIVGGGRGGIFGVVLDLGTPDACLKCLHG